MAHIIDCATSVEIDSSQPGIQLSNEDRAQHISLKQIRQWFDTNVDTNVIPIIFHLVMCDDIY